MNSADLERICAKYKSIVDASMSRAKASHSSHMHHITDNLIGKMWCSSHYLRNGECWINQRDRFLKNFNALRKYIRLINEFPEFREAETKRQTDPEHEKYFKRVSDYGNKASEKYVTYAWKKLTGRKIL